MEVPRDIPADALEVFLSNNRITSIPAAIFSHLTQCTGLHLESNQISSLDKEAFDGLELLQILRIHWNKISAIEPGTFSKLHSVVRISLVGNLISGISSQLFAGLRKIQDLALDENLISTIEEGAFDSLYSLKTLSLSQNRLKTLGADLFINLPRPFELLLVWRRSDENMLDCASLCWLKHETQHVTITWWDGYTVRCVGGEWATLPCGDTGGWWRNLFLFHGTLFAV